MLCNAYIENAILARDTCAIIGGKTRVFENRKLKAKRIKNTLEDNRLRDHAGLARKKNSIAIQEPKNQKQQKI